MEMYKKNILNSCSSSSRVDTFIKSRSGADIASSVILLNQNDVLHSHLPTFCYGLKE